VARNSTLKVDKWMTECNVLPIEISSRDPEKILLITTIYGCDLFDFVFFFWYALVVFL
jgi:hypothetical protein